MSVAPSSSVDFSTPLTLGDLKLKNRIVFAPSTRNRNNTPNEDQAKYYSQRATAGLIISEGTLPTPQGYEFANAPGIYSKKQIKGWKQVTDAVHSAGGLIVMQMMHVGRVAHPLLQAGQLPLGPSPIAAKGGNFRMFKNFAYSDGIRKEIIEVTEGSGYVVPEEIEDPTTVLSDYRQAFLNAKEAGFDGVEVHGANGYLVHQFLDSSSNQRNDEWGGSPEKRCKFALAVIDTAIEVFGSAGRVGLKISPCGGFNDMGMPEDETMLTYSHLLKEVSSRNLAYVHMQRWFATFDPIKRGTPIDSDKFKALYKGNWLLNGEVSRSEGLELLSKGGADAVVMGRFFLSNPDLPRRLIENLPLNMFDWTTFYVATPKGYADYPSWDETSQEEKDKMLAEQLKAASL